LLEQNEKVLCEVKDAKLVTMMYAINELYERNISTTLSLIQKISSTLKDDSYFLVVDPVSNQINFEKSIWLDKVIIQNSKIRLLDSKTRKLMFIFIFFFKKKKKCLTFFSI